MERVHGAAQFIDCATKKKSNVCIIYSGSVFQLDIITVALTQLKEDSFSIVCEKSAAVSLCYKRILVWGSINLISWLCDPLRLPEVWENHVQEIGRAGRDQEEVQQSFYIKVEMNVFIISLINFLENRDKVFVFIWNMQQSKRHLMSCKKMDGVDPAV